MTATLLERPTSGAFNGCRKRWCLNVNYCAREDTGGAMRFHQGRTSSVRAGMGSRIDVTPCAFDTPDWTPFGTPSVTVALHSDSGVCAEIDLKPDQARRLAATIDEF